MSCTSPFPRIGILYPGNAAEDDYPQLAAMIEPPVDLRIVHTEGPDVHRVDECLITGSERILANGAHELKSHKVETCMWACTSGSFSFGVEGARLQVSKIEKILGVPTSSTSLSFLSAIRALGLKRVAIAATYPRDLANAFRSFLEHDEVEVLSLNSLEIWSGREVGEFDEEKIMDFVLANDHPNAEAVLVPDTALRTATLLPKLEASLGKIVLTANQVTFWEAIRLAGTFKPQMRLGRLFSCDTSLSWRMGEL
ncbi:MAG: Arylmalonate decarboxylase [Candidatus Moanabacter tarae]|uniref:Arylmalonate decarboxylase n=1 Tax=Candidatus Moanibacter tarae TaxID=2200854 RepID=A0A2Z4ACF5_9BACT|nr:MAG: Arylmalonate decarboxylase [Candidatus Moanabacter tarae]|tara:strand:- start:7076 stop:7837 length:762 start_codon:yes stop_codon:yes gene_type:complete